MKKYLALFLGGLCLVLSTGVLRAEEENVAALSERDQNLLQIWKDHAKMLTRERDEALKQIEALKAAGSANAAQSQMPSAEQTQIMDDLKTQIASLQSENAHLEEAQQALQSKLDAIQNAPAPVSEPVASNGELENLKIELEASQKSIEALKEKNEDIRRAGEAVLQDRDKALTRIAELENQTKPDSISEELKIQIAKLEAEKSHLQESLNTAQKSIDSLKAKNQELQSGAAVQNVGNEEIQKLRSDIEVWQKKYQILEDNSLLQQSRIKDLTKKIGTAKN